MSIEERFGLIEKDAALTISKQCELLGLSRSSYYYQPKATNEEDLKHMGLIDKIHTAHPEYGRPRITFALRQEGYVVNEKRVGRLMRLMNIQSVLPKPNLSKRRKDHEVYPYLLRDKVVVRPQEVWATDITYIPMAKGFMYLTVVMDWYSRYILSWELSNCMDTDFCIRVFELALKWGVPAIFNSDQGSQYTSAAFTNRLLAEGISISMDGKGRAIDNVFVERLWRTIKYEYVYLHSFDHGHALHAGLKDYIEYYNNKRPHSSLGMKTPSEVYLGYVNAFQN